MSEKLEEIYEKASDLFMKISKKFDKISDKLYQQTGTKINVGLIVGAAILLIFVIIFVKAILGFILNTLYNGNF